jgi:hypothetical protein
MIIDDYWLTVYYLLVIIEEMSTFLGIYIYIISSYFIFVEPFWLKQMQKKG